MGSSNDLSLIEDTDVDGLTTRDEWITPNALSSGGSHFSMDVTGGGLTLHVGGSGGSGRREHVKRHNNVKTEYLLQEGTSSSSFISLSFQSSDDMIDIAFSSRRHFVASRQAAPESEARYAEVLRLVDHKKVERNVFRLCDRSRGTAEHVRMCDEAVGFKATPHMNDDRSQHLALLLTVACLAAKSGDMAAVLPRQ